MSGRILIIEDDDSIRATTRLVLEDEGYTVDEATSAEEGLQRFERLPADCVLLDIMLPSLNGFDCCREIRKRSDVPIIMVTARSDAFDVVAGLEAGADDYVSKPFEPKELTARLRALLRRVRGFGDSASKVIRLGEEIEVVPDEGLVRRRGEPVHLTRTEFRLLCEMAAAPNRVFSRETLLSQVWGYGYFGEAKLVDVHIRRLRTKIEDDPASPRYVQTVRGLGYKVVP
ncbi:MAG TPA: response regulator transcription factor [Acidimicrobiales bacterium]|nr:response regulator transcription factor [Acidimicrobiales bacterium]